MKVHPHTRESYQTLYPFAGRTFPVHGANMHYLDEGEGEPLVMLHGNPTWSFYFRELIKALRPEYRCIAPDHVGCGLSDKPSDDEYEYTLKRRVDDLEALLEHLGLTQNVTLVLHDWGGMIGAAWALRKPDRVKRLVILNTAAFLLPEGKRFPLRLWALHGDAPWAPLLVQGCNAFAGFAARMATHKGMSAAVRQGYLAPYDSWDHRIATLRFVQDIPLDPSHPSYNLAKWGDDNLHQLSHLPTLICWGMHDFVFDRHFLAEWRRRFPNADVHEFADAGHYVLEDETTAITKLVQSFLARIAVNNDEKNALFIRSEPARPHAGERVAAP